MEQETKRTDRSERMERAQGAERTAVSSLPVWQEERERILSWASSHVYDLLVSCSALFFGLIAHLYSLTNPLGSDDFVMNYYGGHIGWNDVFSLAGTGRWLTIITNNIAGHWFKTPFFKGLWILALMGLTAVFFARIFKIRGILGSLLAGAVIAVSPSTQAYITLRDSGYAVSVLLCTYGAYCFAGAATDFFPAAGEGKAFFVRRDSGLRLRPFALVSLLWGLALSIMPANLSCILVLIVLWLLQQVLTRPDADDGVLFKQGVLSLVCCALAGVFLLAGTVFVQHFFEVPVSGYQGAEEAMSGGFVANLLPSIVQTFKKFIVMGVWKIQIEPCFAWTLFGSYLADLLLGLWFVRKNRILADRGKTALTLFLIIVLIPALCVMTILSYGFMYRGQHRQALYFLLLFPIPLLEAYAERRWGENRRKVRRVSFLVLADLCLMVYGLALYDNIGYAAQDYAISQDRAYCTRILASLDREREEHGDAPVYFVNVTDWDADLAITPMKYDWNLYSTVWPVATTNLYCYQDDSFRAFIEVYLGVTLEKPEAEVCQALEEAYREETESVPVGDFRIRYLEDENVYVILVKTVMPPNVLYG